MTAEIERATFADLADEWFEGYWSDVHYDTARQAFKRDVLPHLGNLPVKPVVPVMITPIVEAILRRGSDETARRVLQHIRKVFQHGVGKGIIATNPASATHEMLAPTRTIKHRPAITDLDELRDLLGDADRAACTEATRMAHRLTAFSASRIGPVVEASWAEFDFDAPLVTWTIPRVKQKKKTGHSIISFTSARTSARNCGRGNGALVARATCSRARRVAHSFREKDSKSSTARRWD